MNNKKRPHLLYLSHYLLGVRLDNWLRLLWRCRFRIRPSKIPEALFITLISLLLFPFAILEGLVCAIPLHRTKITKDPVFILGHWRSGTTYLQNLMSRDPQFDWFSPMNTAMFSNYVLLGWLLRDGVKSGIKDARPMDNVQYTMDLPMEETFALGNFTPFILDHLLAFPLVWEKYVPYVFVDELPPRQKRRYRRAYQHILKKKTMTGGGKRLVLKSPDNTAQTDMLRELYPDAKFVNIYRDPYAVVDSTVNMIKSQINLVTLTKLPDVDVDDLLEDMVIHRMTVPMYKKLIAEESTFKPHHFVSVKYEDFVTDPERYLRYIYQELELDGFEEALPRLRSFIAGQKSYQTNHHAIRPRLREKINQNLGFYFEHYGYEMVPGDPMKAVEGL
ncbi:MAG: sulfotransferase [Oscillospiraceae bacterium]|nr:sulfotransferase [Oscillospiraceae bacterium]